MCAHPYNNHLTPALGKTPLGGAPQQYRLIPQAGKLDVQEMTCNFMDSVLAIAHNSNLSNGRCLAADMTRLVGGTATALGPLASPC